MRDFVGAVRAKVAELIELFEQIANGRFSGSNLTKSLKEQAEAIDRSLDVLWENAMVNPISAMNTPAATVRHRAHAETGQALAAFEKELEQARFFGGTLSGTNSKTAPSCNPTPSGGDQIASAGQNMAQTKTAMEIDIFSLAHIREQAMKTLRCESPEPDRVLSLLQDP